VLAHVWRTPLSRMVQSWKSFVAGKANGILGRSGRFWEPEYWDTFMRDEKQERTAIRYIEANPVKARLCRAAEGWLYGSARFRNPKTRQFAFANGAQSSSSA